MNNIKKRREELGISRIELSKAADVPIRTLENWEYEKTIPTNVYQLHKIAKVLNCIIEDLIIFDED